MSLYDVLVPGTKVLNVGSLDEDRIILNMTNLSDQIAPRYHNGWHVENIHAESQNYHYYEYDADLRRYSRMPNLNVRGNQMPFEQFWNWAVNTCRSFTSE